MCVYICLTFNWKDNDHSVAASNLLRTRQVRIQQRTFCSTFFLTANNFSVI